MAHNANMSDLARFTATAAAAATAATAGLAYLDAKLHLRKDLDNIALQRKRERGIAAACESWPPFCVLSHFSSVSC